jgi:hypothetical protein
MGWKYSTNGSEEKCVQRFSPIRRADGKILPEDLCLGLKRINIMSVTTLVYIIIIIYYTVEPLITDTLINGHLQ